MPKLSKSPFPGCDPYLQRRWEEFHTDLIVAIRDGMRGRLPEGLRARIQKRILLEETNEFGQIQTRQFLPDVSITHPELVGEVSYTGGVSSIEAETEDDLLVAVPQHIALIQGEITQRYIEVADLLNHDRVITTIELLSPTNKAPGEGHDSFRGKQRELRASGVSLVEIDLIRGGLYSLSILRSSTEKSLASPYRLAILRGWDRAYADYFAITLQQRLPCFAIPLRRSDPTLKLDLQAAYDAAYDRGDYSLDIRYGDEPDPPLIKADRMWVDELLRKAGLRK